MARTRLEIKTLVRSHTGRTKDTLESSLCNNALKLALSKHPFNDAISTPDDFTLTEDEYRVDISSCSALHIVTARIVEADGSRNTELKIKNRTWFDKHIVNPEDTTKGWPVYCMHVGNYIYFDRPLQSGLELRLRVTTEQTFASDDTTCPIACLDLFVEKLVTSEVFLDVHEFVHAAIWKIQALGPKYEAGEIGGALGDAIKADLYEIGEDVRMEVRQPEGAEGLSVNNLISWSERYGETDVWW